MRILDERVLINDISCPVTKAQKSFLDTQSQEKIRIIKGNRQTGRTTGLVLDVIRRCFTHGKDILFLTSHSIAVGEIFNCLESHAKRFNLSIGQRVLSLDRLSVTIGNRLVLIDSFFNLHRLRGKNVEITYIDDLDIARNPTQLLDTFLPISESVAFSCHLKFTKEVKL